MTRMPQFLKKSHTQILNVWSIYIQNWDKQNIAEQSSQQIRVFHPFHQISHLTKSLICSHLSFKRCHGKPCFFRMNSLSLCWSMSTPITPPQSTLHSHESFEGLDLFSFQMLRSWRNHEKIRPFTGDFFKVFARSQRKATKTLEYNRLIFWKQSLAKSDDDFTPPKTNMDTQKADFWKNWVFRTWGEVAALLLLLKHLRKFCQSRLPGICEWNSENKNNKVKKYYWRKKINVK